MQVPSTNGREPKALDASLLTVSLTESPKPIPDASTLTFGTRFTDHMLTLRWSLNGGWEAPEIKPYGPLALDPSSTVLHYAPTLFEGMKAYRDVHTGVPRLFRPDMNMARMNRGSARLAFPTFDGTTMTTLIKKLVSIDEQWIPSEPGCSLYIRPTMIGTRQSLGVGPSDEILLFIIMSPVGPYYPTGHKPVSLLASTEHVRAWPGGTGGHKLGLNYGGSVFPQLEAAKLGYQQILWLFGDQHELTEVGMMNLFVVFEHEDGTSELATPPLADMILPGVTRDSVLSLAKSHADPASKLKIAGLSENLLVSERTITMSEIVEATQKGTIREIFGSGTAATISAVDRIGYEGVDYSIPCGNGTGLGHFAGIFFSEIVGRQLGRLESDWSVLLD